MSEWEYGIGSVDDGEVIAWSSAQSFEDAERMRDASLQEDGDDSVVIVRRIPAVRAGDWEVVSERKTLELDVDRLEQRAKESRVDGIPPALVLALIERLKAAEGDTPLKDT